MYTWNETYYRVRMDAHRIEGHFESPARFAVLPKMGELQREYGPKV